MSFFRSVNSFLTNKVADQLKGTDPRVNRILDAFLPGLGGGVEDYRGNAFLDSISTTGNRLAEGVQNAGTITNISDEKSSQNLGVSYDWRARLRPKAGGADAVYQADKGGLLAPLKKAGGIIWQETPSIFLTGTVDYNMTHLHGQNYPIYTYMNSTPPILPITADFFANDMYEGQYLLAVFHFLRSVTKGYFGESAIAQEKYGTPPPVLIFEYMGDHGFNKVPVIIRDYSIQLPPEVDYVPVVSKVGEDTQTTYMPTRCNITINLAPSYTPKKIKEKFDVEAFRNGRNYKDGFI